MRRSIIYLCIALLTFALGTIASLFFYNHSKSGVNIEKPIATSDAHSVGTEKSELLSTPCACHQDSSTDGLNVTPSESNKPVATISGGVLNGKALNLPQPQYPAIAKAAHASGTVTVFVTIDERGCIISARAVSGHPLLQAAAVQAAQQACFAPTRLSGQPVKVTGVLTYYFEVK